MKVLLIIVICFSATVQSFPISTSGIGANKDFQRNLNENATGTLLCCKWVGPPTDPEVASILQELGIINPEPLAAKHCTTLKPNSKCNQDQLRDTIIVQDSAKDESGNLGNITNDVVQPVECITNDFNGIIALGCSPVNLKLKQLK